jgi:uncharacterized protein (TIGR02594 family)
MFLTEAEIDACARIYREAQRDIGTREIIGPEHNDAVVEYFAGAGHVEIKDDETPWCAAFVGAILGKCGVPGSGSLLARSYEKWGRKVDLAVATRGAVVVLNRPGGESWQGHVGFFSYTDGSHIYLLGGNQNNEVNVAPFPISRVVGVYVPKTLRPGSAVQSKSVKAGGVGVLATGAAAAGQVTSSIGVLGEHGQLIVLGFMGIAALMLLYMMRDRIKKWAEGVR